MTLLVSLVAPGASSPFFAPAAALAAAAALEEAAAAASAAARIHAETTASPTLFPPTQASAHSFSLAE